ncbi:MAG: uracil-DNA glycosylase [Candidatus Colwellbacteria bacterium]|nr:uracil-DNA glycosylase [Candidatus Colwellbacteria bacterium]
MTKELELAKLLREMANDALLPLHESRLVFGEGDPDAEVMLIGEAPGFYEDLEGKPFVGRAGKLLDKLIEEADHQRQEFYITNIVKRRPPNNRDPLPEEIGAYKPYLEKQIDIIAPKIIIALGRYAMNYFLPEGKISRDQGKIFWWQNALLMPLYHPAAALRRADLVNDILGGLKKISALTAEYETLLQKREPHTEDSHPRTKEQPQLFS